MWQLVENITDLINASLFFLVNFLLDCTFGILENFYNFRWFWKSLTVIVSKSWSLMVILIIL